MAITVGGTNITMNDSTVQATAFLGGRATVFTANGTFTIPTGITAIKVTVVGGGAGGTSQWNGASAALAIKYLTGLTAGNTLAVTVGAAGAGTTSTTSTGGNSSVASGTQSITTIQANGGSSPGNTTTPIAAATTSGADIAINGQRAAYRSFTPNSFPGGSNMYGNGGLPTATGCCSSVTGVAATGYGAGGNHAQGGTGFAGAPGIVIFEY
jgi:hypothetical protein